MIAESRERSAARSALAGLWAPVLTPLDRRGRIDGARLAEHAQRLRDEGCDGILLFGTTGEAASFARDERQAALEGLLAAGFPPGRLLVGTGSAAVTDAVALTQHAREGRVLGVLVLPPFYYKAPPRAGLVAYYDAVLTPLADGETFALFYDFPRLAGVTVGTDLVREIAVRHGTVIAGVKDSSGDIASVEAYCRALKACDALAARAVFPGTEAVLVDALAAGASGLISATANLGAPLLRAVLAAWHAGDRVEALRLQAEAVAFREPFERAGMIPALKAELARRRGDPGWRRVRPPWTEMPEPVSPAAETSVGGTGR